MDLSCKRCWTKKFRVTLGATCAYIICLRCGQEFGTVAGALPDPLAPDERDCQNPWHDPPVKVRRGHCLDCGAGRGANAGLPDAPT